MHKHHCSSHTMALKHKPYTRIHTNWYYKVLSINAESKVKTCSTFAVSIMSQEFHQKTVA